MFCGEHINSTEDRAVLHTALRAPRDAVVQDRGQNVVPEVWAVLDKIRAFTGGWPGRAAPAGGPASVFACWVGIRGVLACSGPLRPGVDGCSMRLL